jgi:hypothetical protein
MLIEQSNPRPEPTHRRDRYPDDNVLVKRRSIDQTHLRRVKFSGQLALVIILLALELFTVLNSAVAWNIPGHMLSGSIAYQILRTESLSTIAAVKAILEKHPWYVSHWKEQLDKLPESQRDEMLYMLAPRWADDIRAGEKAQHWG